ncbi:hypothetical protein Xmau_02100 [Xenorhabdus mauleonii]|uniref:Uncharacterized protein n=1 Tax=Xenorhabdus mauleonii TaxID=351675 RepID=A0A2G0P0D1_9GAMM|nr:hypothetical protein Xmau_02100 [Xenorhabdus mauleonii]
MYLVTRSDAHIALVAAHRANALTLRRAVFIDFMASGFTAHGETNATAAEQPAFFLLFQQIVGLGFGSSSDVYVITRLQSHILITNYCRTTHSKVIACRNTDTVTTKQGTLLTGDMVFLYCVGLAG